MSPEPIAAPLRLKLDFDALVHNWRRLDELSGTAAAGAAVKADGYGLGARRVVQSLAGAGCRDFFVAHFVEAEAIRDLIPAASVSVLHGPLDYAQATWARETGVRPVLNSLAQVSLWREIRGGPCDLMVDTGMGRLGILQSELGDDLLRDLKIEVLLSHLASAEEQSPQNELQRNRWDEARAAIPHQRASLANSAGITLGSAFHGDLTRPGISLFGGVPCAALEGHIRQVAYPEAALIQVRDLAVGDTVGYNATFTADRPMRIGIVSLGYADGYLRCWSGKGTMLHGDARLPVLGRVSMDMTAIDLSAAPHLREGDWVSAAYDLPTAAAVSGLSQYELLTLLGRRFVR